MSIWLLWSLWVNLVVDIGVIDLCVIVVIRVGLFIFSLIGIGVWVLGICVLFIYWEKLGILYFFMLFSMVCLLGFNICLVLMFMVDFLFEIM